MGDTLATRVAYTYSRFVYVDDPVFNNNYIPGAPQHFIRGELRYDHFSGFWIAPSVEWVPVGYFVNSANTVKTPSYVLGNVQIGFDHKPTLERLLRGAEPRKYELRVRGRGQRERAVFRAWRRTRLLRRRELEVQMMIILVAALALVLGAIPADAAGPALGPRQELTVFEKAHEAHVSAPALAVRADGRIVLAWFAQQGHDNNLFVARPGARQNRCASTDGCTSILHQPPGLASARTTRSTCRGRRASPCPRDALRLGSPAVALARRRANIRGAPASERGPDDLPLVRGARRDVGRDRDRVLDR